MLLCKMGLLLGSREENVLSDARGTVSCGSGIRLQRTRDQGTGKRDGRATCPEGVRQPPADGPSGGIRLSGSDVGKANPIPLAMPYPAGGDKGCVSRMPGSWGLSPVKLCKQAACRAQGPAICSRNLACWAIPPRSFPWSLTRPSCPDVRVARAFSRCNCTKPERSSRT